MDIRVRYGESDYAVTVERGALATVGARFRLDRRTLIVTDDGVPGAYAAAVAAAATPPPASRVPTWASSARPTIAAL